MEHIFLLRDDISRHVLIRLPCAHLYERVVGISEVYHKEEIPLILVPVGLPQLPECHSVDIVKFRMFRYLNVRELHIDVLNRLEDLGEFSEILLFGLFDK